MPAAVEITLDSRLEGDLGFDSLARVELLLRSELARKADLDGKLAGDATAGSGYLLSGDAGMVQLDVRVFYKVTEPYAFVLQGDHVLPALDRLVTRSAVALTAARDLDTILVARPELIGSDNGAAERRERLRGELPQRGLVHAQTLPCTGRQPGQHRHVRLLARREHLGQAVQIDVALTERLAVIRDVEQHAVDAPGLCGQQGDLLRQHLAGVGEDRKSVV